MFHQYQPITQERKNKVAKDLPLPEPEAFEVVEKERLCKKGHYGKTIDQVKREQLFNKVEHQRIQKHRQEKGCGRMHGK